MIVPAQQNFNTLPNGGVFTINMVSYLIKTGANSYVDLSNGSSATLGDPTTPVTYFAGATLLL